MTGTMLAMISQSQIRIYEWASARGDWFTAREMATGVQMAGRTARWHLMRLTYLGVLERRKAFGGCRYRLAPHLGDDATTFLAELEAIRETFAKQRKERPTIGERFTALFRKRDKRPKHDKTADELRLTLAFELAQLGRQARAPREDYQKLVISNFEEAWSYLQDQRA